MDKIYIKKLSDSSCQDSALVWHLINKKYLIHKNSLALSFIKQDLVKQTLGHNCIYLSYFSKAIRWLKIIGLFDKLDHFR